MGATRVRSVEGIHARLRTMIVHGEYGPGAVLSQVQLARMLGVSRTPLREAMRRLEEEGLIESRQNKRARVASASAEALDVRFTDCILLEATGVKVTVAYLREADLNGVVLATTALRVALERGDVPSAERARATLHAAYVAQAGARLRSAIAEQFAACERYRRFHAPLDAAASDEYVAIANACIARDADDAARRIARLQTRLARAALRGVDATYAPVAIDVALAMIAGGA
jgi:DNA-binding GntR family transcriptional regulator